MSVGIYDSKQVVPNLRSIIPIGLDEDRFSRRTAVKNGVR